MVRKRIRVWSEEEVEFSTGRKVELGEEGNCSLVRKGIGVW